MLDTRDLHTRDLRGLSPEEAAQMMQQMIERIREQDAAIEAHEQQLLAKDHEIRFKTAKLEKVTFELVRLKALKFGAKSEAMSAEQRRLFEETLAEDEASLQEQLRLLQAKLPEVNHRPDDKVAKRKPRRQPLPEHLRRVEHRHEPEDTRCPGFDCGKPMVRIGEDVSERLDIVPAEFFVHRHIYGKWACKCCQTLVQEPVAPQVIDGGIPAAGLVAHTLISRFVDHLPYYRQEAINARSGVHTPRSTLAQWSGAAGAALEPLYAAHRRFVLASRVLHADETPVAMLDPGAGKTKRAYVWAYARGALDESAGVVYDFCRGRGSRHPMEFLGPRPGEPEWRGTLVRDEYGAYDAVVAAHPEREAAGCLAHARRKFAELAKAGTSVIAEEALRRIAAIYRAESEIGTQSAEQRRALRERLTQPLWDELHAWLRLERTRVPEGSATIKAIDYSLKHWDALTRNLLDGDVPVDNNHLENLMRPWAMGRKAWLFCGSELAGQRAAMVMSLVQSAKLCGHDPHAYLRDVLERLAEHPARCIDEFLPHRWRAPAA
jgi:transposase